MTNLLELTAVHYELIEKFELSEQRKVSESERQLRVKDLIKTIKALHPDKSESIFKDLKKVGRAKDFTKYFFYQKSGFVNICFYNGLELVTIKENLEISVKNFDWKILVDKYGCSLGNYLGTEISTFVENSDGTQSEAQSNFEYYRDLIAENYGKKSAISLDVNLTNKVKRMLEIKGLNTVIKVQRKEAKKLAKK
jgi:hypothetical protein